MHFASVSTRAEKNTKWIKVYKLGTLDLWNRWATVKRHLVTILVKGPTGDHKLDLARLLQRPIKGSSLLLYNQVVENGHFKVLSYRSTVQMLDYSTFTEATTSIRAFRDPSDQVTNFIADSLLQILTSMTCCFLIAFWYQHLFIRGLNSSGKNFRNKCKKLPFQCNSLNSG